MTGRHVIHTGVYDPMNGGSGDLSLNFTLLPSYLKKANYSTHMVGTLVRTKTYISVTGVVLLAHF
jgi:arylsulfatase A-like enzyme